ncbi:hypothetical protein MUP77_06390 [Candidatus Bathyarchaeota archaeon]|nr:hypothetical protein [Candidatus Bathyarchaeota archaeon]
MDEGIEERIRDIVQKFFSSRASFSFPLSLSRPEDSFFSFSTNSYYVLALVNQDERKRIDNLMRRSFHPFPGLIKPDDVIAGTAFKVENARNMLIERCAVKNMFTLSLGKDCTVIITQHTQSINTSELGQYEYTIILAYIVSFGDEININNFHDYLRDTISYSLNKIGEIPLDR